VKATIVAVGAVLAGSLGIAAIWMPPAAGAVPAVVACAGCAYAWLGRRPSGATTASLDASLATAVPQWGAGRRAALEGMVAELAGPAYAAHALRCAVLADLLAEHLALSPEEAPHVSLAAAVHVLPVAFPAEEDAIVEACEFPSIAISAASAALARTAPAEVVRMAAELRERWDGTGVPARLEREDISMGGRLLTTVCAFDHAAAAGLDVGLQAVRDGSGSVFDPVVATELLHLFRQPWQQRLAA
jgi:HD-GYP domain-containing protein (c-di-GMP phosphodiesterase class II)